MSAGRWIVTSELIRRNAAAAVAMMPIDPAKPLQVEIALHKKKRTNQQNKYLFGVVYPLIAEHLDGWHVGDIHEFMLGEHFGWVEQAGLGVTRTKPLRRSSRLTRAEFSEFVAFIQRFMAERGVFIPDPEPEMVR
jgi:hypothetical protein